MARTEKAQADMQNVREGSCALLEQALERALRALGPEGPQLLAPSPSAQPGPADALDAPQPPPGPPTLGGEDVQKLARALEQAIHEHSVLSAQKDAKLKQRWAYAEVLTSVRQGIAAQTGPYPDDIPALAYSKGQSAAKVIEQILEAKKNPPDAREKIRRLYVKILMATAAFTRESVLEMARAIETSCFNAAVRMSKESEEPPRRQWDSPQFVDIYSTRCGTIAGQLDPASSSCRAYGATLVQRLQARGTVDALRPEELGAMTEKELCPQATAAERAEIAKRSGQKVTEKESIMFRCPFCGQRRCSYTEVQRRSLDEAPDYLCVCLECKRRFTGRS